MSPLRAARVSRRGATIVLTTLLVASGLVLGPPAEAALTRAFTAAFSTNATGDIILIGNSQMTCEPPESQSGNCVKARSRTSGIALNNNDYDMKFVDVDGDSSTKNSSTATLALPSGSRVLFAGLYWGGDIDSTTGTTKNGFDASKKDRIKLATPKAGYTEVKATRVDSATSSEGEPYEAFADVTSKVSGGGDGIYKVADLQAADGYNRWGGWSLVIAYQDSTQPTRNLTIYDGFGVVQRSPAKDKSLTINVSGFKTPTSGPVKTRVGLVLYEGDADYTGDEVTLNGKDLTDAQNPSNNLFNSTNSNLGSANTARNPSYTNNFGIDIDRLSADGILANGSTTATISVGTSFETFYPGVVTFATDLYAPKLSIGKTVTDDDGGLVEPGDVLTYSISVQNTGLDTSNNTVVTDGVPTLTTYVKDSLRIGSDKRTDAADSDAAELAGGLATFRLGTMAVGTTKTASFQVRVNAGVAHDSVISNIANVAGTGATYGIGQTGASNTTESVVSNPSSDLAVTKTGTPGTVTVGSGHQVTYTLLVVNNGPQTEPAAVVVDTLPAGINPSLATTSQGTCSTSGQKITCNLGTLGVGSSATVTVKATPTATAADPSTNTATVSGTNPDPTPGNGTGTASTGVNEPPVAVNDSATTNTNVPVAIDVKKNDSDPDPGTTLSLTLGSPAHGTAVVGANGNVTYTPTPGYTGPDSFTYTISDGRGGTATATVSITVLNAPPVAVDDEAATTRATPVDVKVLANDTDPNTGDKPRIDAFQVTTPNGGTIVKNDNGTPSDLSDDYLVYTPAPTFAGTDSFTYQITDGRPGTPPQPATVRVTVPNAGPVASNDSATTPYKQPVTIDVIPNDRDDNNDPLSILAGSLTLPKDADQVTRGMVAIVNNQVTYTPPDGFSGVVAFTYKVTDGKADDIATVTVTVLNAPPVAGPDTAPVPFGTATMIPVLTNDSDPNADPLGITGTTAPAHGSVTVNPDGTITYTPAPGYSGPDEFSYTIDDGHGGTATATVNVTVANAPPDAIDDARTTDPDRPVTIPVLVNDTDPNGDTVGIVPGSLGPPVDDKGVTRGTVTVNSQNGTVTYVPPPGFLGEVKFPYTITDGHGGTDTAVVTVTIVNLPPDAVDNAAVTDPGTAVTIAVLEGDSDGNGDDIKVQSVTPPAHGTVKINPDGTVTYTPVPDFGGIDTFTYTITDGRGATDTAVVVVTVKNAFPVAVADTVTTGRDTPKTIDVLANDSDPNHDPLTIIGFDATTAEGGKVTKNKDGGLDYTPPPGFTGTDTFSYAISDGDGTATATVTITVPNQVPVAVPDSTTTATNTAVVVGVVGNDKDPDGDPLTVVTYTAPTQGGSVAEDPSGQGLKYTPKDGFVGTDTFEYTISDGRGGTATTVVTITVENGPPVAVNDDAAASPGTGTPIDVLGNDSDPNEDPIWIESFPATTPNGKVIRDTKGTDDPADDVLVYTPNPGFKGTDTFPYSIVDSRGATATATVTVTVSDADPVAVDDEKSTLHDTVVEIPVLANDADPNPGDTVKLVPGSSTEPKAVTGGAVTGTVTENPDGTLSYDPPTGFVGVVTFTYQVTDGNAGTAPSTATVTATVLNAPPVAGNDAADTTRGAPVQITVLGNDSDVNKDTLTVIGVAPTKAGGTTVVNADNTITYTPPAGFTGIDTFEYTISDGRGGTATATITVTVPNEPPKAVDDAIQTTAGTPAPIDVLVNDSDPRGDTLIVIGFPDQPKHGSVKIDANGVVVYTPELGYTGEDTFTYEISDGRDGTSTAKVTVDVLNTPPRAGDDNAGTLPDTPVTVEVLANDSDPDEGHKVKLSEVVTDPAHGTVKVNDDGTITYRPDKGFAGRDTFIYEILDGHGGSDIAVVTIEVSNAAPVALDDLITGKPATPLEITVLDNDFDPNPDDTVSVVPDSLTAPVDADGNPQGTVSVDKNGVVTYTPPPGFAGVVTFDYAVTDGDPATPHDTATVTVTIPNAPPKAADDAISLPGPGVVSVPIDVLKNDSDPNADPLTVIGTGTPAHGRVIVGEDGRPVYTPDPDFIGIDSFEYTISDGHGGTSTAKVTITVPAPPVNPPVEPAGPGATPPVGTEVPPGAPDPAVLGVIETRPELDTKPRGGLPATGRSILEAVAAAMAALVVGHGLRLAGRRRRITS